MPKWVGAAREYKATGTTRYRDIAANAWNITVAAHTYVIGGNSQAEHFRAPNAISTYLRVSFLFWFVGLIPDLASMRDRATKPWQKVVYGLLAGGWRGSALTITRPWPPRSR